jgi:hypothetical protein
MCQRLFLRARYRTASPSDWSDYRRDSSKPELLRDLRSPDRRADFGEQPVRLAELALARSLVTADSAEMAGRLSTDSEAAYWLDVDLPRGRPRPRFPSATAQRRVNGFTTSTEPNFWPAFRSSD